MNSRKQVIAALARLELQLQTQQIKAHKHACNLLQWVQEHVIVLSLGLLSIGLLGGRNKTIRRMGRGLKRVIHWAVVKAMIHSTLAIFLDPVRPEERAQHASRRTVRYLSRLG